MKTFPLYMKSGMRWLCVIAVVMSCIFAGYAEKSDNIFVKFIPSKNEFYAREYVLGDFWLYSDNPEIQYIKEVKAPALKGNKEFSYLSKISKNLQPRVEEINGKKLYAFPIGSYIMKLDDAGKYELRDGEYEIGVNVPTGYVEPYFGRGRYYETVAQTARLLPASFKVAKLPDTKDAEAFSGAIGNFRIKTIVPPGDIFVNEDATLIVAIEGKGVLPDDVLPEYSTAFGDGNKLKSFKEHSDIYTDGDHILSKKELECVFVPTDLKNCRIGKIRFCYFNPDTKRYETAESEPIEIEVKSSAVKIKPVYI